MSQIKIRAWEVKSKCMLEWITICQTAFNRSAGKGEYGIMYKVLTATEDDFIIMQWTGYTDKNGKDIYAGDIFGTPIQLRCVVEREPDGKWMLRFFDKRIGKISILDDKIAKSPIIGNIYENKDLIP